jgi:hypothetical protein
MKAVTIFLGYVLIINLPRILFIGRTDTFTSDILKILGGVCQLHQQQHGERQAGQVEHGAEPKEASIAATQRPPPARSPETCSWFGTRLGILRPHFPFHTLKAIYNLLEMANLKTLMLCLCMDNGICTSILLLIVPVQISYR